MTDTGKLSVTINPQLLKAQAPEETARLTCNSRGCATAVAKQGPLVPRLNQATCGVSARCPELGRRKALEVFSLPLGGAEAFRSTCSSLNFPLVEEECESGC